MIKFAGIVVLLLSAGCASAQYLEKGTHEGIEVAYRWKHPVGKSSELHVRLKNVAAEDKHVNVVLDLYYQGRTVETFEADTCIRVGQSLSGRLNGIYFIPQRLTTEQIKDGSGEVELTRTLIEPAVCP